MTRLVTALCLLALLSPVRGADLEAQVPTALKHWIPWVFEGKDQRDCPLPAAGGERLCGWPGRLDLDLDAAGGLFAQHWHVDAQTWVPLPGGRGRCSSDRSCLRAASRSRYEVPCRRAWNPTAPCGYRCARAAGW